MNVVVRIAKSLDIEFDAIIARKFFEIGLQERVDSLSRKAGGNMQESIRDVVSLSVGDGRAAFCADDMINAQRRDFDRQGASRIAQDLFHEATRDEQSVEFRIEMFDELGRNDALLPEEHRKP
ncbi:hypothetical protein [Methylocystis sp. JR02]|uniref:hypothetical protein n=1 Tax=Methylocystis sp. JR02 TaxID=3046284 RepID=UPI0024BA63CD|nr:hypothetical protein [Methylocystis sp. JR02]MDJ0447120.1 hypothetical protein [Methylocystis sp. JR02]